MRPLGIPTIKDRVVQTAAVMILGSIFDADLPDEQHAYREGRDAGEAVKRASCLLNLDAHREVIDADLTSYFDTIPHPELMKCLARRITDSKVLRLIKMWLEAPAEEYEKETGRKKRTTVNKDTRRGVPQGSPISPLLSNVYMREFILKWKKSGYEEQFQAQVVNYADDMVICCKRDGEEAMKAMRQIMTSLGLTIN
jgi:retron-type reverse transcriptase